MQRKRYCQDAAYAKSVRTWSTSSYAIVWPGSLNPGSRTAAAYATWTVCPTAIENCFSIHWFNIRRYYRCFPESTTRGMCFQALSVNSFTSVLCRRVALWNLSSGLLLLQTSHKVSVSPRSKMRTVLYAPCNLSTVSNFQPSKMAV